MYAGPHWLGFLSLAAILWFLMQFRHCVCSGAQQISASFPCLVCDFVNSAVGLSVCYIVIGAR